MKLWAHFSWANSYAQLLLKERNIFQQVFTPVKIKFVGLDSWKDWEKDLEDFAVTLLAEMGPMLTAVKKITFVAHLALWS